MSSDPERARQLDHREHGSSRCSAGLGNRPLVTLLPEKNGTVPEDRPGGPMK
jgi:hypothetical protein